MSILDHLRMSETRGISDMDDASTTSLHARIIRNKPILRKLYTDFYTQFKDSLPGKGEGMLLVELGSGGGFIKDIIPGIVTSDITELPGVDRRIAVSRMPFGDRTVDAFFIFGVLHHISDVETFFREVERCLKARGRLTMIEPAMTPWGRFVYRNFHHEPLDLSGRWTLEKSGRLSSSNLALPWIIFFRDRRRFEEMFPSLDILALRPHTPLLYILSGGLSYRQLAPSWAHGLVRGIEKVLSPLNGLLGLYMTIVLEKAERQGGGAQQGGGNIGSRAR